MQIQLFTVGVVPFLSETKMRTERHLIYIWNTQFSYSFLKSNVVLWEQSLRETERWNGRSSTMIHPLGPGIPTCSLCQQLMSDPQKSRVRIQALRDPKWMCSVTGMGSLPDPGRQSVYILTLTIIIENETFLYLFVLAYIIRNIINVHALILLKNPDKLFIRITPHCSSEFHRLIIYCRKKE